MKKLFLTIFLLLGVVSYAQVNGCVWSANADTTGETDYLSCGNSPEFFYVTTTLADSSDTLTVWVGTNQPDTSLTSEHYVQVSLRNVADNTDYTEITGDEAEHTYIILWNYKRKNIMIKANAISDTTAYIIEGY